MEITDGWLTDALRRPSDNCDQRPQAEISLIVVHCISLPAGHYGNDLVPNLFTNSLELDMHPDLADLAGVRVASHLLVRRDGRLEQFVPFEKRAWHAGESEFQGRSQCNDFSIGVELEGVDTGEFTDAQYHQLIRICRLLCDTYSIPSGHILGHSDIAPGRKTDPGIGFDWQRLHAALLD